jgi:hypothetical protein
MGGPAVKRFVTVPSISRSMLASEWFSGERGGIPEDAGARLTVPSISRSMLASEWFSGERGGIPEDAGARLTMERLRRRIRLIYAGYSEEQSRMTPFRRELPPSRGASRPDPNTGRRIASARTLQSCSHRAVADAARESRNHYS